MISATDFLDAFRTSFVNKDTSSLDSLTSGDFTFSSTVEGTVWNKTETLEWVVSGDCQTIDDFKIIHDGSDSIAGTHTASGTDWSARIFFFAKKTNNQVTEWHVTAIPKQN